MKLLYVTILSVLFFSVPSQAALTDSFFFTGIIKNISKDKVTVSCQGQKFQILKTDVLSGIVNTGEPIYFKIKAEQMQNTFFKRKPAKTK